MRMEQPLVSLITGLAGVVLELNQLRPIGFNGLDSHGSRARECSGHEVVYKTESRSWWLAEWLAWELAGGPWPRLRSPLGTLLHPSSSPTGSYSVWVLE